MACFSFIPDFIECNTCTDSVIFYETQTCSVCEKDFCKNCMHKGEWIIEEDGFITRIKAEKDSFCCEEYELNYDILKDANLYYVCSDKCNAELTSQL